MFPPLNPTIEEWCIKQAKKNEERVKQIMRAAGIPLAEAIKVKANIDGEILTRTINREIKRKKK
jgi:hypothetical protein